MTTDLTERGLEGLICRALTGDPCDPPSGRTVGEPPRGYSGVGWSPGNHHDYNREYCVDLVQLRTFLQATQPNSAPALRLDEDCPTRRKFLARLQGEISKRGTIDVLRNGIKARPPQSRPLLRHALGPEREGPATLHAEPLHRYAPAPLQPRRHAALAGHRALHQRAPRLHL